MQAPPPLPGTVLERVLAVARADGWSIVAVALLSAVFAATQGAAGEAGAALLVVAAGSAELHGRRLLQRRRVSGVGWLVAAQLALLAIIWAYAWWRWRFFDAAAFWDQLPRFAQAQLDRQLLEAGFEPELDRPAFLGVMNAMVCLVLAFLTLLYQGGMALYYHLRRRPVADALLASPPPQT